MRVGILGSGSVGQALGAGCASLGHAVLLGTREPQRTELQTWSESHAGTRVGTLTEAAQFGELLILATLGRAVDEAVHLAGPSNFDGKALIDATNPIADAPPINGVLQFFTGANDSLGERIQRALPKAHVVKAFNSVGAAEMFRPQFSGGPPTMFHCGNDAGAKRQVAELIESLGWEPYDCGGIEASRGLEGLCIIWCAPGFLRNDWSHAFKMLS